MCCYIFRRHCHLADFIRPVFFIEVLAITPFFFAMIVVGFLYNGNFCAMSNSMSRNLLIFLGKERSSAAFFDCALREGKTGSYKDTIESIEDFTYGSAPFFLLIGGIILFGMYYLRWNLN